MIEDLDRQDPTLVKRVTEPDRDLVRFEGRPWPASARRFELTDAGECELARLRGDTEDAWNDDENENG